MNSASAYSYTEAHSFQRFISNAREIMRAEDMIIAATIEKSFLNCIAEAHRLLEVDDVDLYSSCLTFLNETRETLLEEIRKRTDLLMTQLVNGHTTYDKVNVFSVLHIERREDPHSYFLSWLLDPEGNHGLEDRFLRVFLRKVCEIHSGDFTELRTQEVIVRAQAETGGAGVPDIEIRSSDFICIVENKITAGETYHEGIPQTRRYADHYTRIAREEKKPLFLLYLVPPGRDDEDSAKVPSDARFKQLFYSDILCMIEEVLKRASPPAEALACIKMFAFNIQREICHEFDTCLEGEKLLLDCGKHADGTLCMEGFLSPERFQLLEEHTDHLLNGEMSMSDESRPFEFSRLVKLYCENAEIVKTLEQKWKEEIAELVDRVKKRLSVYEHDWTFDFFNTYGELSRKSWNRAANTMWYSILFEPERIGRGKIGLLIKVKNKDARIKICEELGGKIKEKFGLEVSPKFEAITWSDPDIDIEGGNYEEAIIDLVKRCIAFAPNLEPYLRRK